MSEYMQAPEYLCGHMKSEIKDEKTLKLIDAAYNQGRRDQASHAVVDSVAAELATALRDTLDYYIAQNDGVLTKPAQAALARYDALHKEAGQ